MKATFIASVIAALAIQLPSQAETVRIASLDMLSGPLAGFGQSALKHWKFLADKANKEKWAGDTRFEIVAYDTKMSPQEALNLLQQVAAQDIRYVVQGASSSNVGLALEEAIQKHNDRHPGREIVYINYASAAPAMTNEKCSFWHFRTDANVDMKIKAMATHLAANQQVRKVYLLNPNYAYGQDSAKATRKYLSALRPDIQIVNEDFHPTGQVKDFAPYIAKIKASGADTLVTVSFGADLALMVRAANESGLDRTNIVTLSGNSSGMASSFGEKAQGRVQLVSAHNYNDDRYGATQVAVEYRARTKEDMIFGAAHTGMRLLARAIRDAKTSDPTAVARAMEGMSFDSLGGPVEMRPSDHQLQMPVYIDSWTKVDGKQLKVDQEASGFGWRTRAQVSKADAGLPTSCAMKRPAS